MYAEQMHRKLCKDCETQTALPRIHFKYNSIQSNECLNPPVPLSLTLPLCYHSLHLDDGLSLGFKRLQPHQTVTKKATSGLVTNNFTE